MNTVDRSVKVYRKSNIFPFARVKIVTKNIVSFSRLQYYVKRQSPINKIDSDAFAYQFFLKKKKKLKEEK